MSDDTFSIAALRDALLSERKAHAETLRLRYCAEDDAALLKAQYDALLQNSRAELAAERERREDAEEALKISYLQGSADTKAERDKARADLAKLEAAHGQNMREIDRLRAELAAERDNRGAYEIRACELQADLEKTQRELAAERERAADRLEVQIATMKRLDAALAALEKCRGALDAAYEDVPGWCDDYKAARAAADAVLQGDKP